MKHESRLRAAILSARDKPEAALAYARWLLKRERFTDALIVTEAALAEGPRFDLYELRAMTTLTGSALLALAVSKGRLSAEAAWAAAHVDEDWNIERWGPDEEAMDRRSRRWAEMDAAARLVALL